MKSLFKHLMCIAVLWSTALGQGAPVKVAQLPVSIEPQPKLLSLTEAGIRAAFPAASTRPDAVFLTEDRKVSVAFEWRSSKLSPAEIDKLVEQFPSVIRSQVPNITSLKANVIHMGSTPWAQFVISTPGKSDELRRELLMTSAGGRILVITIAANAKDYSKNEPLVRGLTNSIKVY